MVPDRLLLETLTRHGVPFVVIGGHAVNVHGYLRATEDTDVLWVRSSAAERALFHALEELRAEYIGAEMTDAFGARRPMRVETWSWLIGMTAADDARLLEWARSFESPPPVEAEGARLGSPGYSTAQRATLLTVEKPVVTLSIRPTTPCVNPVFEFPAAPPLLDRIELDGRPLPAETYAWDGRTLWLEATLRHEFMLRLAFAGPGSGVVGKE